MKTKKVVKLIIAGSRGITNYHSVEYAFKNSPYTAMSISEIVCGCAKGIDTLGKEFAYKKGMKVSLWKPDWDRYGKQAGIIRNKEMGNHADALLAIWDGESSGTKHMIEYMYQLGKQVFIYNNKTGQIMQYDVSSPKGTLKFTYNELQNNSLKYKLKSKEENAYS